MQTQAKQAQNDSQNQQKKKKIRRPRSAAGERNYLCGCNKAYLSYPALYTHVKNKHGGVFPIGSNAKRKILKNEEDDIEENFVANIDVFFAEFKEFTQEANGGSSSNDKTLTQLTIENVFTALKEKDSLLEKELIKSLSNEEIHNKKSIVQTLSQFLFEIYPYCKENFFQEYVSLIMMLMRALEIHGNHFVNQDDNEEEQAEKGQFCLTNNVLVVSKMTNLFIAEHFPTQMKQFEDKGIKFTFLGIEDEQIKNLILMCKFLSNWFFHKKISFYRMEINVDF